MRRLLLISVLLALAIVTPASLAQSSSDSKPLGDVARETRNAPKKPSARVYDDENFPRTKNADADSKAKSAEEPKVDENGNPIPPEASKSSDSTDDKSAKSEESSDAKASAEKSEKPEKDKTELTKEWKTKIAAARGSIELIEREISVAEREYKLRASSYYSDAGLRLRNEQQWLKAEKEYRAEMDTKQQRLAKAKETLETMLDEARRAGVNGVD